MDHVRVLAHDSMEGRLAGSPGHRRVAQYVARQFQEAGLQPGNGEQYLQPVLRQSRFLKAQPVNTEAAAEFNRTPVDMALYVANDEQRPAWKNDNLFRRFAQ